METKLEKNKPELHKWYQNKNTKSLIMFTGEEIVGSNGDYPCIVLSNRTRPYESVGLFHPGFLELYNGTLRDWVSSLEELKKEMSEEPKTVKEGVIQKLQNDEVNRPAHYTDGKIEVIDFIEDKNLNFHKGNAVKYISRAGKTDHTKTIQDLEKAVWYLNREIERIKGSLK